MVKNHKIPEAVKNYQAPMSTTVYRIYDPNTGELVQELKEDHGCYGANHGPDNERCGGCTSCLVMQAEHSGLRVEEVKILHYVPCC